MKNQQNNSLGSYITSLCNQYKIYLISLCIIAVLASIFSIAVNYKIKEIIDTIAYDKGAELTILLALFAFYKLMHHGMYFINRLLDIRYKPRLLEQVVKDIYDKTIGHSLHWFDSHLSGEISNKISDFQSGILTMITAIFRSTINVLTVLISLYFLLTISVQPAAILGVFVLIYTPIIYLLMRRQMQLQEEYVTARQETIGIINDSISNIFGIKIIGNSHNEYKLKLIPSLLRWKGWERKTRVFDAWWVDNTDTIMIVVMSTVQIYCLSMLYQNDMITPGGFAFAAMITLNIHGELDDLLEKVLFSINPGIAQLKSSYTFINEEYDVKDNEDAKVICKVKGEIEYKGVSFAYGDSDKSILKGFDLNIKPGERLGVVGMSGAGKTTMTKCLLRYFDVQSGSIFIDGNNIADVTQESLRANISIIPQDITMFHRTIRENLQLAKADATDKEITDACKKAKIHEDIMAMEKGYDSVVGERGVKVSGGQRQRIAIARAILKNAPILILDEATSSLDTPTETLIQESINEVLETSNATVIAIAHRLSTLKHMDRIIVLDKGKIVEEGKHDGLIRKKNGFYKKLWEMQVI